VIIVILGKIENINTISASAIFPPFNYAYIVVVPSILLIIFSVAYAWNMSLHSIQKFKESIKGTNKDEKKKKLKLIKKSKETKEKEPAKKEPFFVKKEQEKPEIDEERASMEQWLAGEVKNMEEQASKEIVPEPQEEVIPEQPALEEEQIDIQEEKPEEPIQDEEETPVEPSEDTKKKHVFQPEKTKEISEETDEVPIAQSFEKALSSAIHKKQNEIDNLEPLEDESEVEEEEESEVLPEEKEEIPKKKISVRCPQCRHIFTFQKEGKITKIKCPECGKEGIVK